ncbi:MAG: hypothetical protein OXN84_21970 [Albidovulum sp.]|nr:hypothetical protein [Albidovulum sp.]
MRPVSAFARARFRNTLSELRALAEIDEAVFVSLGPGPLEPMAAGYSGRNIQGLYFKLP